VSGCENEVVIRKKSKMGLEGDTYIEIEYWKFFICTYVHTYVSLLKEGNLVGRITS